jgi:hypothetical protein
MRVAHGPHAVGKAAARAQGLAWEKSLLVGLSSNDGYLNICLA